MHYTTVLLEEMRGKVRLLLDYLVKMRMDAIERQLNRVEHRLDAMESRINAKFEDDEIRHKVLKAS